MAHSERNSLIASIEYLVNRITEERSAEVAASAFRFYEYSDLESLSVGELWEIYGDLHQIDMDLK